MSDQVSTVECPNCGATIDLRGPDGKCSYCGATLERRDSYEAGVARTSVVVTRINLRGQSAVTRRSGGCGGTLLGLALILIIGAGVLGFLWQQGVLNPLLAQISGGSTTSQGSGISISLPVPPPRVGVDGAAVLLERDGSAPDLLFIGVDYNSSERKLFSIDNTTRTLRWQSEPLSDEWYYARLLPGAGKVYLFDQDRVTALDQNSGEQLWSASLSNEINTSCETCTLLFDNTLITQTKDGVVQAFDAQTGTPLWNYELIELRGRLIGLNNRLGLIDTLSADDDIAELQIIEPRSGEIQQRLSPNCSDDFANEGPSVDSSYLVSPDQSTLVILYGFFNTCLLTWDLETDTPRWERLLEGDEGNWFPDLGRFGTDYLFHNDELIFARYSPQTAIVRMSLADGSLSLIELSERHNLQPLTAQDDLLLVLAIPTYDSTENELWGIDLRSGERSWLFRPANSAFGTNWYAQLFESSVLLVECSDESPTCSIEALNMQSGVSTSRAEFSLERSMDIDGFAASTEQLILTIGSKLYIIDGQTHSLSYSWP